MIGGPQHHMSLSLFSKLSRTCGWSVLACVILASAVAGAAEDTSPVRRIATADALKSVKFKIQPEYPAIARQLRLRGTVDVDVQINATGMVDKVTLVNGDLLLANSVISAVKKWKFNASPGGEMITRLSFAFNP